MNLERISKPSVLIMACRAVFCLASANLSSLHVLHFLFAHCSAAMLASPLFLKLRRPLLPQILQTCCLLCCQASCARSMQPMPVHPFGSSLDCHFLREVSVGSAPPSPELTSSASLCSQASSPFPSEHAPRFLSRRWLCFCCVVSHLVCKFSDGRDWLTVVQRY